jgi:threonine-phosphate decarboxylase
VQRDMNLFSHGGDVKSFAKKLGCEIDEVIDLSSNIHFNSPHVDIQNIDFKTYPKYDELYNTLAHNYNISNSELEIFNGGSSAIFSLMRFFENENCIIYSPAYSEYRKAAKINSKKITFINRFENINENIKENSIVVFVNPSTPDGSFYDIKEYLDFWQSKKVTVIIDESFIEFTSQKSIVGEIKNYDNLHILKSLTKFYGCAGIRCGIVVSNEENITKLKAFEPQWKISQYDSLYIQAMLKNKSYKEKTIKEVNEAKEYLKDILDSSELFEKVYDSSANYFLVKLKNMDAQTLQSKLEAFKIMVRDCSNFDFLDSSFVRIAVKTKEESSTLKKALDTIV